MDLSRLTLPSDATYRARVDLGRIEVIVPKDTNVVVHYSTDLGQVRAYGTEIAKGTERRATSVIRTWPSPGSPR